MPPLKSNLLFLLVQDTLLFLLKLSQVIPIAYKVLLQNGEKRAQTPRAEQLKEGMQRVPELEN